MYEAAPLVPWHTIRTPTEPYEAERRPMLGPRTYEISFAGQAGPAVRAEFDDCRITVSPGQTTLHAVVPDQCALSGLIQRVIDLRLDITHVLLVTPPGP